MDMKGRIGHSCLYVFDLEKSINFYTEILGLKIVREFSSPDGSAKRTYVGDGHTEFSIELTWLRDNIRPYEYGEYRGHICVRYPEEALAGIKAFHGEKGIIVHEIPGRDIYFITDPDGYWVEIIPIR